MDGVPWRAAQVPCLATKPEHRDAAADGALNVGTDQGAWAGSSIKLV